jgi:hypothetical protein
MRDDGIHTAFAEPFRKVFGRAFHGAGLARPGFKFGQRAVAVQLEDADPHPGNAAHTGQPRNFRVALEIHDVKPADNAAFYQVAQVREYRWAKRAMRAQHQKGVRNGQGEARCLGHR